MDVLTWTLFIALHSHQQSLATWETESKMYCRQTLLDGNGPRTFWTRELRGDELILVRTFVTKER